jgi:hypothetical protein
MNTKPKAVENFEQETLYAGENSSVFLEHPVERLKFHIMNTGGKILKSEYSIDGIADVLWEAEGKKYRAWSTWPAEEYKIDWKTA